MRRTLAMVIAASLITISIVAVVVILRPPPAQSGLVPILEGLNWPVALEFAQGGRIFYAERFTGAVRVIEGGSVRPEPLIVLPSTLAGIEQGLLGLALHPDFPQEPWLYAYQSFDDTANGTQYNRIVRFRADLSTASSIEVVLDRIPTAGGHNGGVIAFGPDGMLYAVTGDAADEAGCQDLRLLNGKTLRMNPDGSPPADNPFFGRPDANPLVFTYGHRNMFGIAFHPITDDIFVTENGPDRNDEVNLLLAGGNYGWPLVTGSAGNPSYIDPLVSYTPPIAPTNVAVYTGPNLPTGGLVFGDYNGHLLHYLELGAPGYRSVVSQSILTQAPAGILDVEIGPDGRIWLTTSSGIYAYAPPA